MEEMVSKSDLWKDYNPSHESIKNIIKEQINNLFENQVIIGYYLKRVNDECMYKDDGFNGIGEYAYQTYGIEKDRCSWLIRIADKFCKEGAPCLKDEWKPFSISKLRELTYLTDDQLKEVKPEMTVKAIREMKPKKEKVATSQLNLDATEYKSDISIRLEKSKSTGQCIHRAEFSCTLPEASKLVTLNGENCSSSCCWNCNRHGSCGYECNSSAHRPEIDNSLESVNEYAQLIQEVPKTEIEIDNNVIEETEFVDVGEVRVIEDCEIVSDQVEVKQGQPELTILRNNDQRKEFIDTYTTWPIWIEQPLTGEKYYRYDLSDKVAMVVKVSLKHARKSYKESNEYEYGAEQYYLLGVKTQWSANQKTPFAEDDTRTFYECNTNRSTLVDYLREFQKGAK